METASVEAAETIPLLLALTGTNSVDIRARTYSVNTIPFSMPRTELALP